MRILGVETSCDDTCAAVLRDGMVASSVVSSQHEFHRAYGGVVPEIAARQHSRLLVPVIREALDGAATTWSDLDAVAVTTAPGLIGALLVGVATTKGICLSLGIPLIAVNHLTAHLHAAFLAFPDLAVPHVSLLVSGGHTLLFFVGAPGDGLVMGSTLDDAAGEALDKAAHLLGLGYPGGPALDRVASRGDPGAVSFPRPLVRRRGLDFSFSGLKTALVVHVQKHGLPSTQEAMADLAASYLEAVVEVLTVKTMQAAAMAGVSTVTLAGGVAANRRLRAIMADACRTNGLRFLVPPPELCTDNAAMVAAAAATTWNVRREADLGVEASAAVRLQRWGEDGGSAPCSGSATHNVHS